MSRKVALEYFLNQTGTATPVSGVLYVPALEQELAHDE